MRSLLSSLQDLTVGGDFPPRTLSRRDWLLLGLFSSMIAVVDLLTGDSDVDFIFEFVGGALRIIRGRS